MAESNNFTIHALELGPMENFVYLLHDHSSNTAAIVDPAWDVEEVLSLADEKGIRITDILLTHSHHDHVNGIEKVLAQTDAQIHLLKAEARFWGKALAKPKLHHGGDSIKIGETEIKVLHTPGHTPGSACYHAGSELIAGDTLFVFGCGRCDLQGGDPEEMFSSLKRIKSELPGSTILPISTSASLKGDEVGISISTSSIMTVSPAPSVFFSFFSSLSIRASSFLICLLSFLIALLSFAAIFFSWNSWDD